MSTLLFFFKKYVTAIIIEQVKRKYLLKINISLNVKFLHT